jgi:two-component system CheB/CheR fusion protein
LADQLKLATDSAKVGIWSFYPISSKLNWSDFHKIMCGYAEHSENLTYEDWHKVIVPDNKEYAFQKINQTKVDHTIYEVAYRIRRANDGAIV